MHSLLLQCHLCSCVGWCEVRKVPKITHSDTNCNLRVSQTTLSFDDLLEGFAELRNAIELTVTVYYNELMQIKISQEKRGVGQHPGKSHAWSFQLSPTSGVVDSVNSPGNAE